MMCAALTLAKQVPEDLQQRDNNGPADHTNDAVGIRLHMRMHASLIVLCYCLYSSGML